MDTVLKTEWEYGEERYQWAKGEGTLADSNRNARTRNMHGPVHSRQFVDLVLVWANCCSCLELHCLRAANKTR